MDSAQRYRELVAHLESHCPWLGEFEMMRISGASSADQARLRCHELEMCFVAESTRLAERKLALVDFAGKVVGPEIRRRRC